MACFWGSIKADRVRMKKYVETQSWSMKESQALILLFASQPFFSLVNCDFQMNQRMVPVRNMSAKEISDYEKDPALKPQLDFQPTGQIPQPKSAGLWYLRLSGQIIGGSAAAQMQFPWLAYIIIDDTWLCGGSLISADWVLTAAHCVYTYSLFVVSVGGIQRTSNESGEVTQTSTVAMYHESYNNRLLTSDIAVIKMQKPFPLNQYINVIRLPKSSEAKNSYRAMAVTASGFGMTSNDGPASKTMNYVMLRVITNAKCAARYGKSTVVSSCLCTAADQTKSTCFGDSGGPLMLMEQDKKFTQVGVVSFVSKFKCTNNPAGYARVTSFLGWISTKTGIAIRN